MAKPPVAPALRRPSDEVDPVAAMEMLLAIRKAQASYLDFIRFWQPAFDLGEFQVDLINTIDLLEKDLLLDEDGNVVHNLLVTMPPRFAKSTFCTALFPPYYMARDPQRFVMSCSYNQTLSTDFGRQVRAAVEDPRMAQVFPELGLSKESRSADVWRTTAHGAYFAVGIGGTTSGRPANLLILDDPIKSRDDAESATQRNKTWNYYTSALTTRLQPTVSGQKPKQIIVLTRWHPDDVAGRLMRSEDWKEGRWKHINYQAITTRETGPLLCRSHLSPEHPMYVPDLSKVRHDKRYFKETETVSLWPERFPLDDLLRRQRLNPREFASLYQQEPYIVGGNLIKTSWFQTYPADLKPERFVSLVITVDTAFKKTEASDYSVAVVAGIDRTGDIYIVDVVRGRYEFPDLKRRMITLNGEWRGKGLRAIYVEDKASGQSLIQELKRQSGLAVIPQKTIHDKVSRVNAILPLIEGGRVFLPDEAPWLDAFMSEVQAFPGGTHDDQVDALTMAIDVLSRTAISPDDWDLMGNLDQSLNAVGQEPFGKSLNDFLNKSQKRKIKGWGGWGA